jgi:hypothetical protein
MRPLCDHRVDKNLPDGIMRTQASSAASLGTPLAGLDEMLDFPINVYEQPCDNKVYSRSFLSPVVFFFTDKGDPRSVFVAFAICDFHRGRLTYITSCSPANARQLDGLMTPSLERHFSVLPRGGFRQVHSVIETVPDESFLAFAFGSSPCGYFYHVDYKKKLLRLITADDFQEMSRSGPVESFGSTYAKDPEDPRYFYLTAKLAPCDGQPTHRIAYYRVSLDLGSITHLFSRPCEPDRACPHATRKYGDYLLSSEFNETEYRLEKSGLSFKSDDSFHDHVVQDYWSRLGTGARARLIGSQILAHPFAFARTLRRQKRANHGRLSDIAIDRCFRGRHPSLDFIWACLGSEDYPFRIAPGVIRVLSLAARTEKARVVSDSAPAHFEIGKSGHVYLSCHNFCVWNRRRYFVKPAAIVKLRLAVGTAEEEGVFQHPTGFRFTSHVMFQAGNREYICTLGQPNRLFLIDAESMELVAFKDLGPNRLSSETDLLPYVSSAKVAAGGLAALSVSEDGKYLAVARADGMVVVDLESMDIIDSLSMMASLCHLAGRAAGEIFHDASHCQRLR